MFRKKSPYEKAKSLLRNYALIGKSPLKKAKEALGTRSFANEVRVLLIKLQEDEKHRTELDLIGSILEDLNKIKVAGEQAATRNAAKKVAAKGAKKTAAKKTEKENPIDFYSDNEDEENQREEEEEEQQEEEEQREEEISEEEGPSHPPLHSVKSVWKQPKERSYKSTGHFAQLIRDIDKIRIELIKSIDNMPLEDKKVQADQDRRVSSGYVAEWDCGAQHSKYKCPYLSIHLKKEKYSAAIKELKDAGINIPRINYSAKTGLRTITFRHEELDPAADFLVTRGWLPRGDDYELKLDKLRKYAKISSFYPKSKSESDSDSEPKPRPGPK